MASYKNMLNSSASPKKGKLERELYQFAEEEILARHLLRCLY